MSPNKFTGLSLAILVALQAPFAGSAYAQSKAQAEEMEKAERSVKAAKQAELLRKGPKVALPAASVPLDPANVWDLQLSDGGVVRIQLRPDVAPEHVARIKELTNRGFYNGLVFHRVIDGFMAQGGDPKGDGTGGSDLPDLKAEFNFLPHVRGAVAMARSQSEDSANSQFFIMLMPRMQLDHKYTVIGRVIEGMSYVDAIEKGEPPANPTKILTARMETAQSGS
ncbi:MAG: peptidylprolyl isomerase [Sphingobium sp.]|jgi:cyclophilin family peptidyl-prolyl cis-trans isomerase|nr:peptidylprolyl isomerase [Sphingobium sp.]MCI1271276.1 peptidylprolyl isomerase [Sphingobium sp.]MCI1757501.1 peptidylprolyl isomerase [Sphingobium sp.]MCI2054309.1 peptidylprolyl isomerase [Sphingobium sp.]